MTKKEKIQEAYGEWWETLKNYVSKNGYVETEKHSRFVRNHFYLSNNIETYWDDEIEFWRPKSLSGIENNNGWIKIESKYDLPKEEDDYHIFTESGNLSIAFFDVSDGWLIACDKITHYQLILNPKHPIY